MCRDERSDVEAATPVPAVGRSVASLKTEREFTRLGPGTYQGKGQAYGFVIWRGDLVRCWHIEPHYGDVPEKTEYANWLLEHYMGLRGPHNTLGEARRMLIDALRADLNGEVQD